jgi:hypothetical protein
VTLETFGAIPSPIQLRIVSDTDFERFEGKVDAEDVVMGTLAL